MNFGYGSKDDLDSKVSPVVKELSFLPGTELAAFQTPEHTIERYDSSDLFSIGATALHAWLPLLADEEDVALTSHRGQSGDRENYPDYVMEHHDVRIEVKTFFSPDHSVGDIGEGYEPSARFEERMDSIVADKDLLLVVSWYLSSTDDMSRIKIGNYLLKPAVDVAYVRDSHRIIEGKFVEGEPRRPAREGDGYNEDDNYGKLFRLHDEQIDEFLSNPIQSYWDQFSD